MTKASVATTLVLPLSLLVTLVALVSQSEAGHLLDYNDVFGPLSTSPLANVVLAALLVSTICLGYYIAINQTDRRSRIACFTVLVGSLLVAKYGMPIWGGNLYQSNFPDALSHTVRGEWVALSGGYSGPPSSLLTWQPGFWIGVAAFAEVVTGVSGPSSPVFSFLIKWSPLLLALLFLPVVYLLLKNYGVPNRILPFAILVFLGLFPSPVWLSEATGGYILYWLFLALLPMVLRKGGAGAWVPFIMVASVISIVHLGLALFAFVALFSALIVALLARERRIYVPKMVNAIVVFSVVWVVQMLFNAGVFVPDYLHLIEVSIASITRSPLGVATSAAYRSSQLYQYVIYLKVVYYVTVIVVPLVILVIASIRRTNLQLKIPLAVMTATTFAIVPLMIGLGGGFGGAGGALQYVPTTLAPFATLGFLAFASETRTAGQSHSHPRERRKLLVLAAIGLLAITATYVCIAGANFLWYPYSENLGQQGNQGSFILCYAPIPSPCTTSAVGYQAGQFSGSPFAPQSFYLSLPAQTLEANNAELKGYYYAYYTDSIFASYFNFGNSSTEQAESAQAISHGDIIYSTPTTMLLLYN